MDFSSRLKYHSSAKLIAYFDLIASAILVVVCCAIIVVSNYTDSDSDKYPKRVAAGLFVTLFLFGNILPSILLIKASSKETLITKAINLAVIWGIIHFFSAVIFTSVFISMQSIPNVLWTVVYSLGELIVVKLYVNELLRARIAGCEKICDTTISGVKDHHTATELNTEDGTQLPPSLGEVINLKFRLWTRFVGIIDLIISSAISLLIVVSGVVAIFDKTRETSSVFNSDVTLGVTYTLAVCVLHAVFDVLLIKSTFLGKDISEISLRKCHKWVRRWWIVCLFALISGLRFNVFIGTIDGIPLTLLVNFPKLIVVKVYLGELEEALANLK